MWRTFTDDLLRKQSPDQHRACWLVTIATKFHCNVNAMPKLVHAERHPFFSRSPCSWGTLCTPLFVSMIVIATQVIEAICVKWFHIWSRLMTQRRVNSIVERSSALLSACRAFSPSLYIFEASLSSSSTRWTPFQPFLSSIIMWKATISRQAGSSIGNRCFPFPGKWFAP